MNKKLISIIGPMYNEESIVREYCSQVLNILNTISDKYDTELILVDDGSSDSTFREMLDMKKLHPECISIVRLSRNFGLEAAIYSGIRSATGNAVVVMDADLQDPPDLILEMIGRWESGYDVITGARISRTGDGLFKKISANFFYIIVEVLSGKFHLERGAANFRLLDRKAVDFLLSLPEVNPVFRVLAPYVGLRSTTVFYDRVKRFSGQTKFSFDAMVRFALDTLSALTIEPLRKLIYIAFGSFFLSVLTIVGIFFLPKEFLQMMVILSVITLLFSLLFFCISLLAEYLGQIFIEVKKRPTSIVCDYLPCDVIQRRKTHHAI